MNANTVHYTPETLAAFFAAGVPTMSVLSSNPRTLLRINPVDERIDLLTPASGEVPDIEIFERISFEVTFVPGESGEWYQLGLDATGAHFEAYSLLESVVEGLVEGKTFKSSVTSAISTFKDLLGNKAKLSPEQQLGLLGELLVLESTIETLGVDDAVDAWLGPQASEHDFGFPLFDVEVKTTKSEKRSHIIGSAGQLKPASGRALFLLSIQLTAAGAALGGFTLPSVLWRVREAVVGRVGDFDAEVQRLGWRDLDTDLYKDKYIYRSTPRAFLVDEHFPAITDSVIAEHIPNAGLISEVSYRIDLTKMSPSFPDRPIDDFCKRVESTR